MRERGKAGRGKDERRQESKHGQVQILHYPVYDYTPTLNTLYIFPQLVKLKLAILGL